MSAEWNRAALTSLASIATGDKAFADRIRLTATTKDCSVRVRRVVPAPAAEAAASDAASASTAQVRRKGAAAAAPFTVTSARHRNTIPHSQAEHGQHEADDHEQAEGEARERQGCPAYGLPERLQRGRPLASWSSRRLDRVPCAQDAAGRDRAQVRLWSESRTGRGGLRRWSGPARCERTLAPGGPAGRSAATTSDLNGARRAGGVVAASDLDGPDRVGGGVAAVAADRRGDGRRALAGADHRRRRDTTYLDGAGRAGGGVAAADLSRSRRVRGGVAAVPADDDGEDRRRAGIPAEPDARGRRDSARLDGAGRAGGGVAAADLSRSRRVRGGVAAVPAGDDGEDRRRAGIPAEPDARGRRDSARLDGAGRAGGGVAAADLSRSRRVRGGVAAVPAGDDGEDRRRAGIPA